MNKIKGKARFDLMTTNGRYISLSRFENKSLNNKEIKNQNNVTTTYSVFGESGEDQALIPESYNDDFFDFENYSFYKVKIGNMEAVLDSEGREIIPLSQEITMVKGMDNIVLIKNGNKLGVLDSNLKVLMPFEYDNIQYLFNVDNLTTKQLKQEFLIVRKNDKWGIYDNKGIEILPVKYDFICSHCLEGGQNEDLVLSNNGIWMKAMWNGSNYEFGPWQNLRDIKDFNWEMDQGFRLNAVLGYKIKRNGSIQNNSTISFVNFNHERRDVKPNRIIKFEREHRTSGWYGSSFFRGW